MDKNILAGATHFACPGKSLGRNTTGMALLTELPGGAWAACGRLTGSLRCAPCGQWSRGPVIKTGEPQFAGRRGHRHPAAFVHKLLIDFPNTPYRNVASPMLQ